MAEVTVQQANGAALAIGLPPELVDAIAERVAAQLAVAAPAPERWVGVDVAADHLACKPQRIYNLVHERRLPHRKEGGRLLFRLSELDNWLQDRST